MLAAIYRKRRASNEIGVIGYQELYRVRDIASVTEPPDWYAGDYLF